MMTSKLGSGDGVRMERIRIRRMLGLVKSRLELVRKFTAYLSGADKQRPTMTHEPLLELNEKPGFPRTNLNMLEMSL
jgi:hypothetical protein